MSVPVTTETRLIDGPEGRTLCIEVGGVPDGDVILVHNGTPNSRLLYPPDVADATRRGARLVGYDRPGYGGSTRHESRTVAAAVDDVRAIAAALGVDRLVSWGISGGGPHVLATAALAPDLVVAAAALASVAPYGAGGLDWFDGMGESNVEDFQRAVADPAAAAVQAASDRDAILAGGRDGLHRQLETILSPTDAAVLTGDLASYLWDSFASGLGPGPEGWIDDGVAHCGPWGFDPADITVPVQVWQGREDRFVPFGHGRWLAARIPGADAHLTDDDGHLTLTERHLPAIHGWLLEQLHQA